MELHQPPAWGVVAWQRADLSAIRGVLSGKCPVLFSLTLSFITPWTSLGQLFGHDSSGMTYLQLQR